MKVNITPKNPQRLKGHGERTSTGILDQIYHRIVVLDDGNNQFILVSVEIPRKPGIEWPEDLNQFIRKSKAGLEVVRLPVNILRINNDIVIWSAPIELFCEISNEIRNKSPFPYTFYFGYSNGTLGYLPTEEEWKHEGYEPSVSAVTPSVEKNITETLINYLPGTVRTNSP